jgi:hypothetical protein
MIDKLVNSPIALSDKLFNRAFDFLFYISAVGKSSVVRRYGACLLGPETPIESDADEMDLWTKLRRYRFRTLKRVVVCILKAS